MANRQRIRNEIYGISQPTYARYANCSNTSWVSDGSTSSFLGSYLRTDDVVIPGFRRRVNKGEVFFNPYSSNRHTVVASGVGYYAKTKSSTCSSPLLYGEYDRVGLASFVSILPRRSYGSQYLTDYSSVVSDSEVRNLQTECATAMLNSRGRSNSNLFETLAEANQTLDLFRSPLGKLSRVIRDAERMFGGRRLSPLEKAAGFGRWASANAANAHLMWQYGIKPILSDIEAIAKGAQKRVGDRRQTYRAKRVTRRESSDIFTGTFDVATCRVLRQSHHEVEVRCMSLDEGYFTFAENIGFTAKGLITLPWDLVTLSFVADWLFNVGDYIGSITPTPGLRNLGSSMVTKHYVNTNYTSQETIVRSGYESIREITAGFAASCDVVFLQRVRTAIPVPGVVINNDFGFNATRLATSFALLGQRVLKLTR